MDFSFSPAQEMIRNIARQFAQEVCEPIAAEVDRNAEFPMDTWKKMAEYGLLEINHGKEFGGAGHDKIAEMIVVEELSKVCLTSGATFALLGGGVPTFIEKFGTKEQREKYVERMIKEGLIGCFCLTEPDAGSDAANVSTTAEKDGDYYVLNGTKRFITAGGLGDVYLIVAQVDKSKGVKGFTGFIIDDVDNTPGFSIGKIESKMGIRGSQTAEVILENARVHKDQILGGKEGKMFKQALSTLDSARIGTGAQALGLAQGAFEQALKYSGERVQFGKPINANQGIQWYLAEMATKIETARWMVYHAAWMDNQGQRVTKEAAMAKLYASQIAREVTNTALQIFGGYGFMNDYPLERMYRDAKITEIYEGSSEIMKVVIAASLIGKKKKK
jgi:alkylation response protein AidB-like acyl-CoA dehydrogenase